MGVNVEYQQKRAAEERGYESYNACPDEVKAEIDAEVEQLKEQHRTIQL